MTTAEVLESIVVALDAIRTRKLRAALTMLGVVIGVASVIAVASIIEGLNRTVIRRMQRLGSKTFMVARMGQGLPWQQKEEMRLRRYLTAEYVRAIRDSSPHAAHVSIVALRDIFTGGFQNEVRYGNEQVSNVILRGVDASFSAALPAFEVVHGRFLSGIDVEHARQVAVMGLGTSEKLFPNSDPLGHEVRLNGLPFEVVGLFERDTGLFGTPGADQVVVIPYTTFERLYPEIKERIIAVAVGDTADLPAAEDEVVTTLRRLRHVRHDAPNDFEIFMPDFAMRTWDQISGALVLLTGAISSITLLVGGIGVMNIMLISVTERTAEIGLRKAAGARRSDIRAQFLVEAIMLTATGGVLGILCGAAIGYAVSAAVPSLPAYVSPFWVVMGLGIAMSVGVFFGFYPANRAAGLDPVVCLRHE